MDPVSITLNDGNLHIEGYPDAIKLLRLQGKKAERLAHMGLHVGDLHFALRCLEAANTTSDNLARQSLWRSAVIHYIKCFVGGSRRSSLDAAKIYGRSDPLAMAAFKYFKNLRDKHFVHDENAYAMSIPCAALNDGGKPYHIEKVFAISVFNETLGQENYNNLHLLITSALNWAEQEFDNLADIITKELDSIPYDTLFEYPAVIYNLPSVDDIAKRRVEP